MLSNLSFLKVAFVLLSLGGFLFGAWRVYDAIGDAREQQIVHEIEIEKNKKLTEYLERYNKLQELHIRNQREILNDVKKYGDSDIGPVLRNQLERLRSSR